MTLDGDRWANTGFTKLHDMAAISIWNSTCHEIVHETVRSSDCLDLPSPHLGVSSLRYQQRIQSSCTCGIPLGSHYFRDSDLVLWCVRTIGNCVRELSHPPLHHLCFYLFTLYISKLILPSIYWLHKSHNSWLDFLYLYSFLVCRSPFVHLVVYCASISCVDTG